MLFIGLIEIWNTIIIIEIILYERSSKYIRIDLTENVVLHDYTV